MCFSSRRQDGSPVPGKARSQAPQQTAGRVSIIQSRNNNCSSCSGFGTTGTGNSGLGHSPRVFIFYAYLLMCFLPLFLKQFQSITCCFQGSLSSLVSRGGSRRGSRARPRSSSSSGSSVQNPSPSHSADTVPISSKTVSSIASLEEKNANIPSHRFTRTSETPSATQDDGCSTPTALEECPFVNSAKASMTVRPVAATLVNNGADDVIDDSLLALADTDVKVEDALLVEPEVLPAVVSAVASEGQAEDDDEEKAIGVSPDGRYDGWNILLTYISSQVI